MDFYGWRIKEWKFNSSNIEEKQQEMKNWIEKWQHKYRIEQIDEVKVETFNVGDELDEDYMELWKDRKIEKARENYPEAQRFYFERPYSDMSYGELLACGDF